MNDLDIEDTLSALDTDNNKLLQELATKDSITQRNELKELNTKRAKHFTQRKTEIGTNPTQANSTFWLNKNELEVARQGAGLNKVSIKVRSCLTCAAKFESEGVHNRLCGDCRKGNGFNE